MIHYCIRTVFVSTCAYDHFTRVYDTIACSITGKNWFLHIAIAIDETYAWILLMQDAHCNCSWWNLREFFLMFEANFGLRKFLSDASHTREKNALSDPRKHCTQWETLIINGYESIFLQYVWARIDGRQKSIYLQLWNTNAAFTIIPARHTVQNSLSSETKSSVAEKTASLVEACARWTSLCTCVPSAASIFFT